MVAGSFSPRGCLPGAMKFLRLVAHRRLDFLRMEAHRAITPMMQQTGLPGRATTRADRLHAGPAPSISELERRQEPCFSFRTGW